MRNRLYRFGPLTFLLGHDVGIGHSVLGERIVMVGRVWGLAVGPLGLLWTENVTKNALRLRERQYDSDEFD